MLDSLPVCCRATLITKPFMLHTNRRFSLIMESVESHAGTGTQASGSRPGPVRGYSSTPTTETKLRMGW